jgi:hypothetical protein
MASNPAQAFEAAKEALEIAEPVTPTLTTATATYESSPSLADGEGYQ